jgi:hypothetical protein
MTRDKALAKALDLMRKPGRALALTHVPGGDAYHIWPDGVRVTEGTAQGIREHPLVQPDDGGLLPGCWQSWRLGRKR